MTSGATKQPGWHSGKLEPPGNKNRRRVRPDHDRRPVTRGASRRKNRWGQAEPPEAKPAVML